MLYISAVFQNIKKVFQMKTKCPFWKTFLYFLLLMYYSEMRFLPISRFSVKKQTITPQKFSQTA